MNKEIKIKLIDESSLKFKLLEKGEIGDLINLNSLNNVDLSVIKEKVNLLKQTEIRNIIDTKLKQQQKELDLNHQKKIIELNQKYDLKIADLEKDKNYLELNSDAEINKKVAEIENSLKAKINKKEDQIRDEAFKQIDKVLQVSNKKTEEINDLKLRLQDYDQKAQFVLEKELHQKEQEIFKLKTINDSSIRKLKEENDNLLNQLDYLKRNKSQNIKLIGNELENWIDSNLQQNFAWNERITIKKEPKPINGQKPDFMIMIKNGSVETKIVIEAKTELLTSENKKTNRSHLEKLENYRKRSESKYAILVSELENEKDFLIYKDSDYKDIFIIRPHVLVSLLQFMINLLTVNEKVLALNVQFEDKQKIIQEWDLFLADVDKTFLNLKNNVENILKEKDKLSSIANKIGENANKILDSHLGALEKKLKKFSIEKKIVNKISEVEKIEKVSDNFVTDQQKIEEQSEIQL